MESRTVQTNQGIKRICARDKKKKTNNSNKEHVQRKNSKSST